MHPPQSAAEGRPDGGWADHGVSPLWWIVVGKKVAGLSPGQGACTASRRGVCRSWFNRSARIMAAFLEGAAARPWSWLRARGGGVGQRGGSWTMSADCRRSRSRKQGDRPRAYAAMRIMYERSKGGLVWRVPMLACSTGTRQAGDHATEELQLSPVIMRAFAPCAGLLRHLPDDLQPCIRRGSDGGSTTGRYRRNPHRCSVSLNHSYHTASARTRVSCRLTTSAPSARTASPRNGRNDWDTGVQPTVPSAGGGAPSSVSSSIRMRATSSGLVQ